MHQIRIKTYFPTQRERFFGAFFAFIFGLITYYIQKRFDRYHKHKNATVELEYLLQENLDKSIANQFLLEGAIETISKDLFAFTLLTDFRQPPDLSLRLGDLGLINKYAEYQTSVARMNHSMQTWQKMNEKLHDTAISGTLTEQAKQVNQAHLKSQASVVIKFLKGMDEETKELVTYVRVFMRKDKHVWSIPWLRRNNKLKIGDDVVTKKEVQDELRVTEKEIEEVQRQSKEKIKKIVES